jgi:hypothetical protein
LGSIKKFILIRIGVEKICNVVFDLKQFPKQMWRKVSGRLGDFYEAHHDVSITFQSALSFMVYSDGVPMGKVEVNYE